MMFLRILSTLAAAAALVASAASVTLTGDRSGNTFTWVLTGSPVASLHINGQQTGDNIGTHTQPTPWTFTGSLFNGDYEWEAPSNQNGAFTFTATLGTLVGVATPTKAQYDYFDSTGTRVLVDIPINPVPEPTPLIALGLGAVVFLRRRRP